MTTTLWPPETRYTRAAEWHIAYQAFGSGPAEVIFVAGGVSHLEASWEEPRSAQFFERLASFSRVILFDKRGVGLSDPINRGNPPTLEQWADDLLAVLDEVAVERASLFAIGAGGPVGLFFAAAHPERVRALILFNSGARFVRDEDYQMGLPRHLVARHLDQLAHEWGREGALDVLSPSLANDAEFRRWYSRYHRLAASPGAARAVLEVLLKADVRSLLPAIRVPTLILHRADNGYISVDIGRYVANHVPNSRFVVLPGADHLYFAGDPSWLEGEVQEFLTGTRASASMNRIVATILFTDIVASTEATRATGDLEWRAMMDRHDLIVRRHLDRFGGRFVRHTGDGTLAVFDGPTRAIQAALAIRDSVRGLGLEIRAGLHAGEIDLRGDDVSGIAVNIAQRVSSQAGSSEILISRTVADLSIGSGIPFRDRGIHTLKGFDEAWRLYAVVGEGAV